MHARHALSFGRNRSFDHFSFCAQDLACFIFVFLGCFLVLVEVVALVTSLLRAMEINIQIKNVQKPEDVLNAFAAISSASGGRDRGIASGGRERGRSRPPIQRQAMRTTAATRRSPSLILSPQELTALQQVHPHGSAPSSTEADTVGEASSGVRPKMKPQTGKAACRTHAVAKAVLPKGRSARRERSAGYTETYIHTATPSHCRQPHARDYLQAAAYQEENTEDIFPQILPNIEIQNTEKDEPNKKNTEDGFC